jgi:hypothetical protein
MAWSENKGHVIICRVWYAIGGGVCILIILHALHSTVRFLHGTVRFLHGMVRFLHGTVRFLHGTLRFLHGTERFLHGTVRFLHGTVRFLHGTVRFLHGTVRYVSKVYLYVSGSVCIYISMWYIQYLINIFVEPVTQTASVEHIFVSLLTRVIQIIRRSRPCYDTMKIQKYQFNA